jgi:hypothetical protein
VGIPLGRMTESSYFAWATALSRISYEMTA